MESKEKEKMSDYDKIREQLHKLDIPFADKLMDRIEEGHELDIQSLCQQILDSPPSHEPIAIWARRLAMLVVDADD